MASRWDGKTPDGFHYRNLRDKKGKIRKGKNGKPLRSYTWRYHDAEGQSRDITRRSLDEIKAERDRIRNDLQAGTYVDPKKGEITLREFATLWLGNRKPKVASGTYDNYVRHLERRILPALGHLPMRKLNATILEGWRSEMINDGLKLGTVKTYWTTLSMVIKDALVKEIINKDPRLGVSDLDWRQEKRQYPYETWEIRVLEAVAADYSAFMRDVVEVGLETGMRVGELVGLCEDQIHGVKGKEFLRVDRQLSRDKEAGSWVLKPVKCGSHKTRDVPLTPKAVEALKRALKRVPYEPVTMTFVPDDDDPYEVEVRFAFGQSDGNPSPHYAVQNRWKKIVKRAKVKPRGADRNGIHRLRHTYAGELIMRGVDLYVVSQMLGHGSIKTTEMYYAHLRTEVMDTVRNVLAGDGKVIPLRPAV